MNILIVILCVIGGIFAFFLPALRGYNFKHVGGRVYAVEKRLPYKETMEGLWILNWVMLCYTTKNNPYSKEGIDMLMYFCNSKNGYGLKVDSENSLKEKLKKCGIYEDTPMMSVEDAREKQSQLLDKMTKMACKN